MSKKRNKSPANNAVNNNKWESNIISSELETNEWSYSLSFLVEDIIEDRETIEYIKKGILSGLRRKFTLLSVDRLKEMILEFGNTKSKKVKEIPLNYEVCECAKLYLDRGEIIPAAVMAKVIKWAIMTAKIEDLKKKDDTGKKVDGKASKSKKTNEKADGSKSSAGKKGTQGTGKKSPEPPSVKADTKLRKRGDPDPDIRYIDDEPDDGSSRYFVVTGISESSIIGALADIGCIASSIIKITRDIHIPSQDLQEKEENSEKSSISSKQNNEIENEKERQTEVLKTFWKDINETLNNNKLLFNTPIVTMVAKHLMFPINSEDSEQQEKCSMELFETVAVSMYDQLDLRRQWRNYLEKSKIIDLPMKSKEENKKESARIDSTRDEKTASEDIPLKVESENLNVTFDTVDMDYYRFLLQDVPLEESSVYLQMSVMLDQVEVTVGEKIVDWNKPKLSQQNDLSEEAAEMLNEMIDKIYLPKEDLKTLRENLKIKSPLKLNKTENENNIPIHGLDGISLRDSRINTNNLGKEGCMIRELRMLIKSLQQMDLLSCVPVDDSVVRKRTARLQEFLKYMDNTGMSSVEINYAIRLFIIESLVLSGTDENGFMRFNDQDGVFTKNVNQIWDDPFMVLDDVSQSIIEEEHQYREMKVELFEELSDFDRVDSSASGRLSSRGTEGILKSTRSRSHSTEGNRSHRRKSSVHFLEVEQNELSGFVTEEELDSTGMLIEEQDKTLQAILLDYLENVRKRSFTEWCFEEFYEPHVMLQIIQQAFYKLPFLDIYSERKTDGKIIVLHNPYHENLRYNHQSWNQWLHANVGFRNYLDFISDKIKDWTRDEEAIYQALLLNKELENSEKPKDEEISKEKLKKEPTKGKKPIKSKSRSRSTSKSSSADESESKEISFILPGSLKAQKMEQDKILKIKEEEERKKEEKRSLSAQKKREIDASKEKVKRPSSKSSNKSKSKRSVNEDPQDQVPLVLDEPVTAEPEKYWPFIGYNLEDDLAHFTGDVAHLFPTDGCTIRVHRTQKLLDSTSVRVSIITTQSHVFSLHIIDPLLDTDEEVDNFQKLLDKHQNQSGVSRYGSSTCVFNDGICLAASNYGYSGSPNYERKIVTVKEQLEEQGDLQSHKSDENNEEMKEETNGSPCSFRDLVRDNVDMEDIQNVIMTSPNGVQVRVGYERDENDQQRRLLLYLTKNDPQTFKAQKNDRLEMVTELGRYITSDGKVISILSNDSIKVMFPDGTVASASLQMESTILQEEETDESKIEKLNVKETTNLKKKKSQKMPSIDQTAIVDINMLEERKDKINKTRKWTIIKPTGEIYESNADLNMLDTTDSLLKSKEKITEEEVVISSEEQLKKYLQNSKQKERLLISCATDPATGETLVTRSDGTLLLTTQDSGIFLSEHVDHTRFTKYFVLEKSQQCKDNKKEFEEANITEIIQIESENYPMITIDRTNGKIETRFGSMGSLISVADGSHLYKHADGTEIEYRPDGEMIFTAAGNSQMSYLQPYGSSSYVLNTTNNILCEMLDTDGTEYIIDINGNYQVKKIEKEPLTKVESSDDVPDQGQLKPTSAISCASITNGCEEEPIIRKFDQHAPRVFFLNGDGSGSELLRYRDVVDTIISAETDKNYFQYKEEIQDYPHITSHTIMNYLKKDKPWKYDYSRKTILPKGLSCRDMKTFPDKEIVKEGPPFAMSIGKGLLIQNSPFEKDQLKKSPKKCIKSTKGIQFRQFYHYPLITDEIRKNFGSELIKYNKSILRQRQKYKELEIFDDRSQSEQIIANEIRNKYYDMRRINKESLDNAIQALSESIESPKTSNKENLKSNELNNAVSLKLNRKKIEELLEKERIEKEKETENKNALKHKLVPNYFTSIYGKDFLMNQAVDLNMLNKSMKLFPLSREATERNDNQTDNEKVKEITERQKSFETISDIDFQKSTDSFSTKKSSKLKEQRNEQILLFKKKERKYVYYDSSLIIPSIPKRMPISTDIPLPRYLYSQRPTVEQNIKQAIVEDPVRRKVLTTSLVGGPTIGQVFQRQCRGLNVLPARIDAGLLREGGRYKFKIKISNTGPEGGFFKIKQPVTSSGIWVEFVPGPIAAGLSREIIVHVYAIAKTIESKDSNVYVINETLKIITNTDILEIPINGRVMTAEKYDTIYPPKKVTENDYSTFAEPLPSIKEDNKLVMVHPNQS